MKRTLVIMLSLIVASIAIAADLDLQVAPGATPGELVLEDIVSVATSTQPQAAVGARGDTGSTGSPGSTGARGRQGPRGPAGEDVELPSGPASDWSYEEVQQTLDNGLLVGRTSDANVSSDEWGTLTTRQEQATVANRIMRLATTMFVQKPIESANSIEPTGSVQKDSGMTNLETALLTLVGVAVLWALATRRGGVCDFVTAAFDGCSRQDGEPVTVRGRVGGNTVNITVGQPANSAPQNPSQQSTPQPTPAPLVLQMGRDVVHFPPGTPQPQIISLSTTQATPAQPAPQPAQAQPTVQRVVVPDDGGDATSAVIPVSMDQTSDATPAVAPPPATTADDSATPPPPAQGDDGGQAES